MRTLIMASLGLWMFGCDAGATAQAVASAAGSGDPAGGDKTQAPARDGLETVTLSPLPLTMKIPPGGVGVMDLSVAELKSATVDVGSGSLNVSEATEDFAAIKKSYQNDKILFPFKKWVKDEPQKAILEFETEGKKGYIGLVGKEVGGKKYVCKTTGLEGVATPELAETNLKFCESLAPK